LQHPGEMQECGKWGAPSPSGGKTKWFTRFLRGICPVANPLPTYVPCAN